jgi:hypothetical protein
MSILSVEGWSWIRRTGMSLWKRRIGEEMSQESKLLD